MGKIRLRTWAHMNLGLTLGKTYEEQELMDKASCVGGKKMVVALLNKLKNPAIFERIDPAVDAEADVPALIVIEAYLLARGGVATVAECRQRAVEWGRDETGELAKWRVVRNAPPRTELASLVTAKFLERNFLVQGDRVEFTGTKRLEGVGVSLAKSLALRLKRISLTQSDDDKDRAGRLLASGASSKMIVYDRKSTSDPRNGDQVFRHPFVQCLLQAARQQVHAALADVSADNAGNWLICVRTYGRSGNPTRGEWPWRTGLADEGLPHLTLRALEEALGPMAHRRCLIFVSHEDPDVVSGRFFAALHGTPWERRVVLGVKGADFQTRFIDEAFPQGAHVVVVDDNVKRFICENKETLVKTMVANGKEGSELSELIQRAGQKMEQHNANVWSINCTHNAQHLAEIGERFRCNRDESAIMSTKLGLVFGAFFGFRALHDPARYTRYGQVKDDVERTLRYWHADGIVLRFQRYGVVKAQKPGVYLSKKGGISLDSSAVKHAAMGAKALSAMLKEFASPYARLALAGEIQYQSGKLGLYWVSSCGASTKRKATKRKADEANAGVGAKAVCLRLRACRSKAKELYDK